MKTVTGRVTSAEPISLSKAATLISGFASSDNGASQDVRAYLQRASAAFNELKSIHREIKSKESKPSSDATREPNPTGEFDRKTETVSEKDSIHGREQDEIKEDKKKKKKTKKNKEEDVVDEKLEDEQRSEERKERKKKSKKNKEEDIVDEKVNKNLEYGQRSKEGKEKNKKKKKRIKEDVVDEEKKKRKSDEDMGSEERKSKKKRKTKEFDG